MEVFTTDALEAGHRTSWPSPVVEDGVHVHRFRNVSNRLAHDHTRFLPIGLRRALRAVDCDVIHLSEIRHELAIATWHTARRRGLPLVVSAHGTLPTGPGRKGRLKGFYDRFESDPMLHAAAAALAQTHHEMLGYAEHTVPVNGPTSSPSARRHPSGPCRRPRGPPRCSGRALLGSAPPLKGVDRLLRGFGGVAASHPEAVLVIAGRDDGAGPELRRLAHDLGLGDRVRFPGAIYGDERYAAYRRADLFAITPAPL